MWSKGKRSFTTSSLFASSLSIEVFTCILLGKGTGKEIVGSYQVGQHPRHCCMSPQATSGKCHQSPSCSHSLLLDKLHEWLPWCCKKTVRAVDKQWYPVHNRGAHKKHIHRKCGCCKTLFLGCEVIGKSIHKSDQWLYQKKVRPNWWRLTKSKTITGEVE